MFSFSSSILAGVKDSVQQEGLKGILVDPRAFVNSIYQSRVWLLGPGLSSRASP
jgi:hypothetical protein